MAEFDWDDANRRHIALHNVTCDEAEEALLNDPVDLAYQMVEDEERITELGRTNAGRILVVVITWRDDKVRVVTAYDAVKTMKARFIEERGLP